MSGRRSLSETILDLGEGALALAAVPGIRPLRLAVSLPVEIRFSEDGFHADLPQFVTRTAFDRPPARLSLAFEAAVPGAAPAPDPLP